MNNCLYERLDLQAAVHLVSKYYKKNCNSWRMKQGVDAALDTVLSTAEASMIWRKFPIIQTRDYCAIYRTEYSVKSRKLLSVLSSCDEVILCATTLGRALDYVIKQNNMRMHYRVVLDQVAAKVVEAVMEIGQKHIRLKCKLGEEIEMTPRYSPGHCDWPIEQQKIIFSLLPLEHLGIDLSHSYLMSPRKSVTALIGIGDKKEVNNSGNACLQCGKKTCEYRRYSNHNT